MPEGRQALLSSVIKGAVAAVACIRIGDPRPHKRYMDDPLCLNIHGMVEWIWGGKIGRDLNDHGRSLYSSQGGVASAGRKRELYRYPAAVIARDACIDFRCADALGVEP